MKKLLLTFVLLVGIAVGLFAQKLTYQAVVRDNNQQLVVNTAVKATVTIAFSTGNPYTTEVNGSTNIHGLLSFEFGGDALNGRNWEGATIAVKVVNAATSSIVYVNDEPRPVSAVPYALSVNGQSIQNYLTEHHYVDQTELNSLHYLTSDSAVITTMQGDIAALQNAAMDCNKVKDCIKDTLDKYTPTTGLCDELSNCQSLAELLQGLTNQISDLQEQVDYLSSLPHGGGDTPAIFTCGTSKVKDVDNNEYNTVKIGSQCWMAQNLRTKIGGDGDKGYPTGADNDTVTYGRLYTWTAMMKEAPSTNYPVVTTEADTIVHGICPAGWHVPSDAEWDTLTYYVFNSTSPEYKCGSSCDSWAAQSNVSCIAKALASKTDWKSNDNACNVGNNPEDNNLTGFSAVPAGACSTGDRNGFGVFAFFWSATEYDGTEARHRALVSGDSRVNRGKAIKNTGCSVRCLRDAGVGGSAGGNEIAGTTPSAPATMSCEQVMECMGDTLGKLNTKIEAQGETITTQGHTIDSLAQIVDSLSNLPHGGGDTPTEVADGQPCPGAATVSDGINIYNTVKIGNQCWMKENLRTSVGDGVYPKKKNGQEELSDDEKVTCGRLYTWTAMMKGAPSTNYPGGTTDADTIVHGICPAGWHVPSGAEWDTLTTYVNTAANGYRCNGDGTIANALSSTTGWSSNISEGCNAGNRGDKANATGFSAVPAGGCFGGSFDGFGRSAYFWSATQYDGGGAWCRYLTSVDSGVGRTGGNEDNGISVRCLRD